MDVGSATLVGQPAGTSTSLPSGMAAVHGEVGLPQSCLEVTPSGLSGRPGRCGMPRPSRPVEWADAVRACVYRTDVSTRVTTDIPGRSLSANG
ncbi:hypothetical protein PMI11_03550 [Rhizobium sp. CF142]|nr:hypothetical protein PMI11_03550 [Rhizobium sp. CF142]